MKENSLKKKSPSKPRKTSEQFIQEARAVHQDTYSYQKTRYVNWDIPVTIECAIHGEFKKIPAKHLAGQGCPECSKQKRILSRRKTSDQFVKSAAKIHKNYYSYEKTLYKGYDEEVEIICREHGSFFQRAGVHLNGGGCPACARARINDSKRDTKADFVKKAREIHKNRYSYQNTIYKNSSTPVTIECKIHGEFKQVPNNHLAGRGCRKCGVLKRSGQRRTTQKEFIAKARKVHGRRFSYEKARYQTNNIPVEIVCPEHGSFFQKPALHLTGRGCPQCGRTSSGNSKRKTRAQFIEDARKVHQDRYSYEKTEYKTCKLPIIIECREHGEFKQAPSNHLNGQGCPDCAQQVRNSKARSTTEEFVEKATRRHNGLYSYEKTVYKTNRQAVEITCPVHGSFFQTPDTHLSGCGCPDCAQGKRIVALRKTSEQFIAEATAVHDDSYDYQKVHYVNAFTPVTIVCPVHGKFVQTPDSHLQGRGCPQCGAIERGLKRRSSLEDFIEKARKVHQDCYTYEEVDYQTALQPVKITCPKHGMFTQTPSDHLSGNGCMACGIIKRANALRKTQEQFIEEAKLRHKGRYSYGNVEFVDLHTPVNIECPDHGGFKRTPSIHLQGVGCPECQKEAFRLKRQENFIQNAREMHGNRYNYDLVHYINNRTHVTIICPIHGPYEQNPGSHLTGHHCMQCYLDLLKRGYFAGGGGLKQLKF